MKHGFKLKLKARGLKCKSRRIANVWLKQCEEKIAHEMHTSMCHVVAGPQMTATEVKQRIKDLTNTVS